MKKVLKPVYCSRCGDFIPPEELTLLKGALCALCENMRLEAQQIWRDKQSSKKIKPNLIYPANG